MRREAWRDMSVCGGEEGGGAVNATRSGTAQRPQFLKGFQEPDACALAGFHERIRGTHKVNLIGGPEVMSSAGQEKKPRDDQEIDHVDDDE